MVPLARICGSKCLLHDAPGDTDNSSMYILVRDLFSDNHLSINQVLLRRGKGGANDEMDSGARFNEVRTACAPASF